MGRAVMYSYWFRELKQDVEDSRIQLLRHSSAIQRQIFTAFLGALACIFQSAGGFLPGIGYAISPLATAPVLLAALYSIRSGIMAYLLTILLLLVFQPSEIMVFPFTTGLLGLGIGGALARRKNRLSTVILASSLLFIGIIVLLYGVGFPVLGPDVAPSFHFLPLLLIFAFCFSYSWLWLEIGIAGLRKLKKMLYG